MMQCNHYDIRQNLVIFFYITGLHSNSKPINTLNCVLKCLQLKCKLADLQFVNKVQKPLFKVCSAILTF